MASEIMELVMVAILCVGAVLFGIFLSKILEIRKIEPSINNGKEKVE